MKVSGNFNISLRSGQTGLNRQNQSSTLANQKNTKDLNFFNRLLAESIQENGAKADSLDNSLPLSQAKAIQLFDIIQVKMNNHLIRTLSGLDENNDADGFRFDLTELYGLERNMESYVSKFQQETPEKNKKLSQIDINKVIDRASKAYDVDPDLITAVVKAESDFDVNSTSPKGAMGLMQLMPETARELGVTDSYEPVENIMAGTRYLKILIDRYDGNVALALAAYNWGMGNLERHPEKLPRETHNYIARVNNFMRQYKT